MDVTLEVAAVPGSTVTYNQKFAFRLPATVLTPAEASRAGGSTVQISVNGWGDAATDVSVFPPISKDYSQLSWHRHSLSHQQADCCANICFHGYG